ncbi:MAG: hypothetical protein ABIN93_11175, partial [Ginsengibacter sp.]
KTKLIEWAQGYAYQMWRGRNNTVRLDGLGGQLVVLIPDKDAVLVFTANNASNTAKQYNLIHDFLIPAIKSDKALDTAPAQQAEIRKRTSALNLSTGVTASSKTNMESRVAGKEFILTNNDHNIQSVYFSFNNGVCTFGIKRENVVSSIRAGLNEWIISNTLSSSLLAPPRTNVSKSIDANYSAAQPLIKVACKYYWTDEKTLEISGRFVEETLGQETIVCKFTEQNNDVRLTIEPKANPSASGRGFGNQQPIVLRGVMVRIE